MPNREMFFLERKGEGWRIYMYMFTYDPKSPIQQPYKQCPPDAPTTPVPTTTAPAVYSKLPNTHCWASRITKTRYHTLPAAQAACNLLGKRCGGVWSWECRPS